MKSLKEALELSKEGILEEIKIRRSLKSEMVGWLYPSILEDEISKLTNEYNQRQKQEGMNHA